MVMSKQTTPICFTTTSILSLSIIILLITMTSMIQDCNGWTTPCNGSATEDCTQVIGDEFEEQEFMMDTEEHMRILAGGTSGPHIGYGALKSGSAVGCVNKGTACAGDRKKYIQSRECKMYDKCRVG